MWWKCHNNNDNKKIQKQTKKRVYRSAFLAIKIPKSCSWYWWLEMWCLKVQREEKKKKTFKTKLWFELYYNMRMLTSMLLLHLQLALFRNINVGYNIKCLFKREQYKSESATLSRVIELKKRTNEQQQRQQLEMCIYHSHLFCFHRRNFLM